MLSGVATNNTVENAIQDGEVTDSEVITTATGSMSVSSAMSGIKASNADAMELTLYSSPVLGDGEMANNPYIHETPEPITRVCWGNYVAVSQAWARDNDVETFETKTNVAKINIGDVEISLPIVVQPGLQRNTIAIPIGYGRGRNNAGKVAAEAGGANAFYLASSLAEWLISQIWEISQSPTLAQKKM